MSRFPRRNLDWHYDKMADNGVWKADTPFGAYELWESGDGKFWWECDIGRRSAPTRELAIAEAQADFDTRCAILLSWLQEGVPA